MTALAAVKENIHKLERGYGDDMPAPIREKMVKLAQSAQYLEGQLTILSQRENLYANQDDPTQPRFDY